MSKINLLHVISTLCFGGAEKQVVTLLRELDKDKYNITLCCLRAGGPLEEELKHEDIDIVFLRMRVRYFFIALYRLVRLCKKKHIQIVHTHLYDPSFWGRIAAWIAGVPVIVATEHGRGMWKKKRHLFFERIANRFTDVRIAVSEDVRSIRIQREHAPPQKVLMIPNAISPDDFIVLDDVREEKRKEFGLKNGDLVFGTVARFDPDKALDKLLEAAVFVAESIRHIRILLVGDGPLRKYLEDYAEKLGISDKIIFTGMRKDIAGLLSIMDVYVNSSIREGIPVSLLEAMAAEKAVVATCVGGNPEVVHDESVGLIVPPQNSKALADGIIALLRNKQLRESMGSKARERIQNNYSIKMQARKIESIYEKLLN